MNGQCEHIEIGEFEVLTDEGWKDFTGIKRQTSNDILNLEFEDSRLSATAGHLIKLANGKFKEASKLKIGDVTSTGAKLISSTAQQGPEYVYDLLNVKDTQSYITNSVVSHNCAFVHGWAEFAASVLPTLSSGKETITIFTSTPNGLNHFYEYTQGAIAGTNGFYYIEIPWWKIPSRDEEWKQEVLQTLNHDLQKFDIEYCCSFIGSSGTLINGATLKRLTHITPDYVSDGMYQYEKPINDHIYVSVVDTSRGKGLDYSAFHIIDVSSKPMKQVFAYRNNEITPTDYATQVYNIANMYNEAHVLVEINDIGGQVVDILHEDYEYENIIYTETGGRGGAKVSGGFGKSASRGIRTTKPVKAVGCAVLKLLIEQDTLQVLDENTIAELNRFSKKANSYEAEDGHDDLVMGLVLFSWLSQDKFFAEMTSVETMKLFRERSIEEQENDLIPFGFKRNGIDEFEEQIIDANGDTWATNDFQDTF